MENNKKSKIEGHRRVSDGETHQCALPTTLYTTHIECLYHMLSQMLATYCLGFTPLVTCAFFCMVYDGNCLQFFFFFPSVLPLLLLSFTFGTSMSQELATQQ